MDGAAGVLTSKIGDVGMASACEDYLVRCKARTTRQMGGEFLAVLADLVDDAAGDEGDATFFQRGARVSADVVVEPAQNVVAAIDRRYVGAEPAKDAGEFQGDVTAAL